MITDVPFDKDGNQLHYEWDTHRPVWVDNFEFTDVLTFDGFHRGRSAAYFTFMRKSNGKKVTVFLKDLCAFFPYFDKGGIYARFTFCKRGQNYGCRLVKP